MTTENDNHTQERLREMFQDSDASNSISFSSDPNIPVEDDEALKLQLETEINGFFNTRFEEMALDVGCLESFWERKKADYPLLYELFMVLSSVPFTQVSVERLFSHLKFILGDQRSSIGADNLNNILFVR